jgi:molybdenum cofactor cytidylyltransferase
MGTPKALLALAGETFLDRLIGVLGARCSPVIVVLGHEADSIRPRLRCPAVVVVNQEYRRGQLSSLQRGLAAVPPDADGVLFTPVDYPAVLPATVEALVDAFTAAAGFLLAIPRFQGRRGHPVGCARALIPEFLALPGTAQARDVIHRHVDRTLYVDVDDPGILRDIDDPEAYRELIGAAP